MLHLSELLVVIAESPTDYPCLPLVNKGKGKLYVPGEAKQGYRDILLPAKGEVPGIVKKQLSRVLIGQVEGCD